MLAALVLPVAAVCFVVGLVIILERPRTRTRPGTRPGRDAISLSEPPPRSTRSRRKARSVGDEAEEWLRRHV